MGTEKSAGASARFVRSSSNAGKRVERCDP